MIRFKTKNEMGELVDFNWPNFNQFGIAYAVIDGPDGNDVVLAECDDHPESGLDWTYVNLKGAVDIEGDELTVCTNLRMIAALFSLNTQLYAAINDHMQYS